MSQVADETHRLPLLDLVAYSLPTASVAYLSLLIGLYYFKFATDVLAIEPAVIGTIFLVARVWDAVSDPLVGFLSDRTRGRLGRRRPWLLASAIPMAVAGLAPWSPPADLGPVALVVWVSIGLVLWETVATVFAVPHIALGAELSMDHHERTRVFAFRHVATGIGFVLVAAGLYLLTTSDDKRTTALWLALAGGVLSTLFIGIAVVRLREREEHRARGSSRPLSALADVWRNEHARLLLIVFLIESLGVATLGVLGPYLTQYLMGDESLFISLLASYFVPSLLFVPVGLPLSRRFGKKATWTASMILSSLAFGLLFFAAPGREWLIYTSGIGAGVGGAIGAMVGPSVQADVIDYDEYKTGERKEGTYFAVWNFVRKCASGLIGWLTGMTLQFVGFEPNVEQTETTLFAMRLLMGGFPFVAFAVGSLIFLRFSLTESEHARIRHELDARAAQ